MHTWPLSSNSLLTYINISEMEFIKIISLQKSGLNNQAMNKVVALHMEYSNNY